MSHFMFKVGYFTTTQKMISAVNFMELFYDIKNLPYGTFQLTFLFRDIGIKKKWKASLK